MVLHRTQHIYPYSDISYNIGKPTLRFKDVYFQSLFVTDISAIDISATNLTVTNLTVTNLTVTGNTIFTRSFEHLSMLRVLI